MSIKINKRQFLCGAVSSLIVPTGYALATDGVVHTIEIHNLKFAPKSLVVRPGDQVRWINRDIAPHTATALNGTWDTGELGFDEEASITVTPGLATDYFCVFHPHMRGELRFA